MRWVIGILLLFAGLAVTEHSVLAGLGLIAAGIGILAIPSWLKSATSVKPVAVAQHTAHAQARRESEALRQQAEYEARRIVGQASKKAEKRRKAAVKAARDYVASEPRWV